ncbi:hypothetical protein [Gemmobacter serpentinus]|uniref:hypothetical protein n=1 Tax=Gemmobacter serpentinus TaxID=2652247 RepID=UPI00124C1151|nr:hypothetical protein [Gemmobacter serpentinus]
MTIWALRLAVLALTLGFTVTGQAMAEGDESDFSEQDGGNAGGADEGVTDDSEAAESGEAVEDDGDFSTTTEDDGAVSDDGMVDDGGMLDDGGLGFGGGDDGLDGDIRTTAAQSGAVKSLDGGDGRSACVGFPKAHVCKQ